MACSAVVPFVLMGEMKNLWMILQFSKRFLHIIKNRSLEKDMDGFSNLPGRIFLLERIKLVGMLLQMFMIHLIEIL